MRTLDALVSTLSLCALVAAMIIASPAIADADLEAAAEDPVAHDAVEQRLLDLDPEHVSARDVSEVLAQTQAPRIILLQGSFGPITMEPFAEFLIAMGYPEERITNPRDGSRSSSSFMGSGKLAGTLAWYYEKEGTYPLLIGHSQGGMLAIRVLYELTGAFAAAIPVWNPMKDEAEPRTSIVDPWSGNLAPVVGLKLPYAAAIATGKLPRLLLGQWSMLPKLRHIPDSVAEFTGFSIEWDLIAGHFPGAEPYSATGSAAVRNVTLPSTYSHVALPETRHLAENAVTRAWIDAYVPGARVALPDGQGVDTNNLLHAADIWYSVKKQWCLKARRALLAKRDTK
jgi:hypothetical protein